MRIAIVQQHISTEMKEIFELLSVLKNIARYIKISQVKPVAIYFKA